MSAEEMLFTQGNPTGETVTRINKIIAEKNRSFYASAGTRL